MGQREDTEEERANWHWRNSMRPVRFFGLDARAAIPLLILFFYWRWSTFILAILIVMTFVFFENRGLPFDAALRAFRTWLLGQKRPGWLSYSRKKFIDYG